MTQQHGGSEICFLSLCELARLLRTRQLSAREVMTADLEQIRRWNPLLNAIVAKLSDETCLALADEADARAVRGEPLGALPALPWAFKDLEPAIGFPNTRGSPIFQHDRPAFDSVLVERLRNAGVVSIGKTNVSEFGLGSQSYNRVYGTTVNPYGLTKSAGGSSGGAGAAVAAGMLPGADGSDFGGSLRNPGNFNNVVGFRPTSGLVPIAPTTLPLFGLLVKGPIARSVPDIAYLLAAMAGPDPRDPLCAPFDPALFMQGLERSFKGVRAMLRQGEIFESMRRFQETYPFVLAAVNQLPPFDAALHWPTAVGTFASRSRIVDVAGGRRLSNERLRPLHEERADHEQQRPQLRRLRADAIIQTALCRG